MLLNWNVCVLLPAGGLVQPWFLFFFYWSILKP
jgi:hypothetical protein